MRFFKKLQFWNRQKPFAGKATPSSDVGIGALEYDLQRLSHDVSMVLMPETRPIKRNYPT